MQTELPIVKSIVPWYGSNRMLAARVGAELKGCGWVGIPFMGSACEVLRIEARTIVCNDLHRHLINLARVLSDCRLGLEFYRTLRRKTFHVDELDAAQARCKTLEHNVNSIQSMFDVHASHLDAEIETDLQWAIDYFVCCWMSRAECAGTDKEFNAGFSHRWDAAGGDSAVRFQSAVKSIIAWRHWMRRCTFVRSDAFDFLAKCKEDTGHGIFVDPPFPGPGDKYKHPMNVSLQRDLARRLAQFHLTRVVARFYDHPLIRELYPADKWTWIEQAGRTGANKSAPEVLIINGKSYTEEA